MSPDNILVHLASYNAPISAPPSPPPFANASPGNSYDSQGGSAGPPAPKRGSTLSRLLPSKKSASKIFSKMVSRSPAKQSLERDDQDRLDGSKSSLDSSKHPEDVGLEQWASDDAIFVNLLHERQMAEELAKLLGIADATPLLRANPSLLSLGTDELQKSVERVEDKIGKQNTAAYVQLYPQVLLWSTTPESRRPDAGGGHGGGAQSPSDMVLLQTARALGGGSLDSSLDNSMTKTLCCTSSSSAHPPPSLSPRPPPASAKALAPSPARRSHNLNAHLSGSHGGQGSSSMHAPAYAPAASAYAPAPAGVYNHSLDASSKYAGPMVMMGSSGWEEMAPSAYAPVNKPKSILKTSPSFQRASQQQAAVAPSDLPMMARSSDSPSLDDRPRLLASPSDEDPAYNPDVSPAQAEAEFNDLQQQMAQVRRSSVPPRAAAVDEEVEAASRIQAGLRARNEARKEAAVVNQAAVKVQAARRGMLARGRSTIERKQPNEAPEIHRDVGEPEEGEVAGPSPAEARRRMFALEAARDEAAKALTALQIRQAEAKAAKDRIMRANSQAATTLQSAIRGRRGREDAMITKQRREMDVAVKAEALLFVQAVTHAAEMSMREEAREAALATPPEPEMPPPPPPPSSTRWFQPFSALRWYFLGESSKQHAAAPSAAPPPSNAVWPATSNPAASFAAASSAIEGAAGEEDDDDDAVALPGGGLRQFGSSGLQPAAAEKYDDEGLVADDPDGDDAVRDLSTVEAARSDSVEAARTADARVMQAEAAAEKAVDVVSRAERLARARSQSEVATRIGVYDSTLVGLRDTIEHSRGLLRADPDGGAPDANFAYRKVGLFDALREQAHYISTFRQQIDEAEDALSAALELTQQQHDKVQELGAPPAAAPAVAANSAALWVEQQLARSETLVELARERQQAQEHAFQLQQEQQAQQQQQRGLAFLSSFATTAADPTISPASTPTRDQTPPTNRNGGATAYAPAPAGLRNVPAAAMMPPSPPQAALLRKTAANYLGGNGNGQHSLSAPQTPSKMSGAMVEVVLAPATTPTSPAGQLYEPRKPARDPLRSA